MPASAAQVKGASFNDGISPLIRVTCRTSKVERAATTLSMIYDSAVHLGGHKNVEIITHRTQNATDDGKQGLLTTNKLGVRYASRCRGVEMIAKDQADGKSFTMAKSDWGDEDYEEDESDGEEDEAEESGSESDGEYRDDYDEAADDESDESDEDEDENDDNDEEDEDDDGEQDET